MIVGGLKTHLEKLAERECWCDDVGFCPMEYAGGNYDDAYYGGKRDGRAELAREVLEELEADGWNPC
jgi:hypothetical protein